ncbi:MAG TPA: sodium:glutamate symporter [Clostridiaceae bacterium]|nr:sodium:glutamate symporter [Clostridiaceae bacterium]
MSLGDLNVSSGDLQEMLIATAVIGMFLFIGAFLRAKVPLLRNLMLPASVIGGTLGLLLGPGIWGTSAPLPFPEGWMTFWSALPVVLIVPIFAAAPLGMFMDPSGKKRRFGEMLPIVLLMTGIFSLGGSIQYITGFGVNLAITAIRPETGLYRTFGRELGVGFAGGHGTAAQLGSILQDFGHPWWQTAQGVALTTATVGLIGGMFFGIILINRATRRGETHYLGGKGKLPREMLQGYTKEVDQQKSLGRETMYSSSIETFTIHIGILFLASGLAYLLHRQLRVWVPDLFIPVWFYALLIMYVLNFIMLKLKLHWIIDTKVKSRITGTLSDFAITAAMMTMPIKTISQFVVPITIMCVIGFIVTYFFTFPLFRKAFKDNFAFERAIMSWGVNTGVMMTGMTLLRVCDPDYESPVISDFSMGFALMSIFSLVISPIDYYFLKNSSTSTNFFWNIVVFVFYAAVAAIGYALLIRNRKKAQN